MLGILAIGLITMGLGRLRPAAPTLERGTLWPGKVERGSMLRQVHGLGTLVPEEILWIPAIVEGRIEKRLALPGTKVSASTVLFEMRNPDLEQAVTDAEWAYKEAEADLQGLKARLQATLLDQRSVAASVGADYQSSKVETETNTELNKNGLLPDLTLKMSKVKMEGLATRHQIENERVSVTEASMKAQLLAQEAKVQQLKGLYQIKKTQVDNLKVHAGTDGVLQELMVQVGQQVPAGTALAKVAQPEHLKAELKIAETQAKDILLGQKAEVDMRFGIIPGKVSRIDPASINGTRTVDVRLEGKLPSGAVPDLSVDGTIELERLENVLYVGRPVQGQADALVTLFKIEDPESFNRGETVHAVRTKVKLGRSSVSTIEIVDGLKAGDIVILSDMSAQDGVDRIRLK